MGFCSSELITMKGPCANIFFLSVCGVPLVIDRDDRSVLKRGSPSRTSQIQGQ